MRADLHMHSYYSDGTYSPKELLELAKSKDLDVIALTDHDAIGGIKEIKELSKNYNIRVIPGFELTTNYLDNPVHILIYFKNSIPSEVLDLLKDMEEKRRKRAYLMGKNLIEMFHLKFDLDNMMRQKGNLTRGHLIRQLMLDNPNFDKKEAFNKYLSVDSKAYIPSTDLSPEEAIKFFRRFPCLIVIAHPTLYKDFVVKHVLDLDIDGIEAYYPRYEYQDLKYFLKVAKDKNLLVTAGSDFHGTIDFAHPNMATVTLKDKELELFLERIDSL